MPDLDEARKRAWLMDAESTLDGTLPYEETWREMAEAVLALAARVEELQAMQKGTWRTSYLTMRAERDAAKRQKHHDSS